MARQVAQTFLMARIAEQKRTEPRVTIIQTEEKPVSAYPDIGHFSDSKISIISCPATGIFVFTFHAAKFVPVIDENSRHV